MAIKAGTEIPTIDVVMVQIEVGTDSYILNTASKISVEPQIETEDAVKLIVKGILKAQKGEVKTLTGNKITLTDNVFIPEVVKILQGGTIKYWTDDSRTEESETVSQYGISSYTPPITSAGFSGSMFTLHAYSAQYSAAGTIVQYEKISYPNCKGSPIAMSSEDGTFRVSEYEINSAPTSSQPPYTINYVSTLPTAS